MMRVPAAGLLSTLAGRRDVVIGLVLAALGAGLFLYGIPSWIEAAPSRRGPVMSPRFLPNILVCAIMVLGASITAKALLNSPSRAPAEGVGARGLVIVLLAIVAYLVLAELLGAMLVAILVSLVLQIIAGERRQLVLLIGGAFTPAIAVLLLKHAANVPLPEGPFGF